jgi:transposase
MLKTDARKLSPEAQETLRIRVVLGIVEEGLSQKEAVKLYRISRAAIIKWMKIYREKGIKGLRL